MYMYLQILIQIVLEHKMLSIRSFLQIYKILDPSESREYICQVFYAKYGINTWKVIFSFIPKGNLEVVIII